MLLLVSCFLFFFIVKRYGAFVYTAIQIKLLLYYIKCWRNFLGSGLNPKEAYISLEKEKQNFCVELGYYIKRARECRGRATTAKKCTKKTVMHVQRCFFADVNLLFLCCSLLAVAVAKTPYCCHPEILLPWQLDVTLPSPCAAAQRGLRNYWKVRSISEKSILEPNLSVKPIVQDLQLIISINHETSYISIPKNKC